MKMDTMITFLIAIIALVYIYLVITKYNSLSRIDPREELHLENCTNELLEDWYKKNVGVGLVGNFDLQDLASKILENVYGENKINKDLLVIGNDISNEIEQRQEKGQGLNQGDTIFDLRSKIGVNLEIGVIKDDSLRKSLILKNSPDIVFLNGIINNNLDILAKNYISQILDFRWKKILELNIPTNNDSGSFLYLKTNEMKNVKSLKTPRGERINLLCSDIKFKSLLERLKDSYKGSAMLL